MSIFVWLWSGFPFRFSLIVRVIGRWIWISHCSFCRDCSRRWWPGCRVSSLVFSVGFMRVAYISPLHGFIVSSALQSWSSFVSRSREESLLFQYISGMMMVLYRSRCELSGL